jgi:hypothetical protein
MFYYLFQSSLESTWVVGDHVAAPGSKELSVVKGQQVDIVEMSPSTEMAFVRLVTGGEGEGLVPLTVLKQPLHPRLRSSNDIEAGKSTPKLFLKMCVFSFIIAHPVSEKMR